METKPYSRLVMFGAASETRGAIAAVVDAYRAHGLFKRWPVEYLAIHGDGGVRQSAAYVLRALHRFGVLLARHRRMAVHLHTTRGSFWRDTVFIAAALAARCPLMLQLHGGGFERFYEGLSVPVRAVMRALLGQVACVIVPTESLRTWVRSVSRNAHVVCLPNPVTQAPAPKAGARANLVLFLGRLVPEKGLFDLLEAVSALRPAVPDVRLVCAGDGDRIAVASYAERLGIADAVKFTGWVGPSGKRALLESAAVFALPSYDEALPIGMLEAMSAGVPVIATPVGGIPEAVVDGVSGYLVAPGDTANLQRLLRKLLLDRRLGAEIGAAGRESARLRFSPERAVPRLEELYAAVGVCAHGESAGEPRLPGMREAA
jgi:glycosyltransferase involved in cell wall biosynthesis